MVEEKMLTAVALAITTAFVLVVAIIIGSYHLSTYLLIKSGAHPAVVERCNQTIEWVRPASIPSGN